MDQQPPLRAAPLHVPILTEVIEVRDLVDSQAPPPLAPPPMAHVLTLSEAVPAQSEGPAVAPPLPVVAPASVFREAAMAPLQPMIDEAQIAQRVLADVQRQIDGMLEYRLREALVPILARVSETLVRELRQELSKTMTDVVTRSVAQEVARQRPRP